MMLRAHLSSRTLGRLGVAGIGLAVIQGACSHEWDAYDPRLGQGAGGTAASGGAGGTGGGGTGTGAAGGAGGVGGGGNTGGTGGAGGSEPCVPGTTEACYGGPAGTDGVGPCQAGVHICDDSGAYGVCLGQVMPGPEDCATSVDDDCEGTTNDHCAVWSRRAGDDLDQFAQGIAVDAAGAVLITGSIEGSADLGGGALASAGAGDLYVAKLGAGGNHLWSKRWGDAAEQVGNEIALDPDGNLYITGSFAGTLDFGIAPVLVSQGDADAFVAKLDPSGNPLWCRSLGGPLPQHGLAIAADATGVVVGGDFQEAITIGGTTHPNFEPGMMTGDAFIAKLDLATGDPLWSHAFGNSGDDAVYDVILDAAGDVLLTGTFDEPISVAGGPEINDLMGRDVLVAKLDGAGAHVWSKGLGAPDDQEGRGVAVDAAGNVIVAGLFETAIDLGGGSQASAGLNDAFVVKLGAANGAYLWGKTWGSPAEQIAQAVATDGDGNVLVGVGMQGMVDFGGGALLSGGADDFVVVKLSPAGAHLFSRRYGDPGDQDPRAIAADAQGYVLVAGECGGTVNFGTGPLYAGGLEDICLAKIAP